MVMNKLSTARRSHVVAALVACERYQDATLRNLKLKRIQRDELWEFVYAKGEECPRGTRGRVGLRRRVDLGSDGR
jgi:hypothetical protein